MDFAPFHFSSTDLPERDRLPFWCNFVARKIVHADVEMLSADPLVEPYRDPARGPYVGDRKPNVMPWALAALAGAFILGLIFWGMSDRTPVANAPADQTTGQTNRAPAKPIPANPNATTPQPDPAQPTR